MDPMVELRQARLQVRPGTAVHTTATVRNSSDVVAEYQLDILGPARDWTEVIPTRISVLRRGETTAQLQFRPPEGTPAGTVPFALRCVSQENNDHAALAEGDLAVGAIHDLTATISPSVVRARWTGRWTARFDNRGTAPVRLAMGAEDERHTLGFRLAPTELRLAPGQSGRVLLKARASRPSLLGAPARQRVRLTYTQVTDPGEHTADSAFDVGPRRLEGFAETAFEQARVLSRMVVAAGGVAVAGALAALVLLSRSGPPQDKVAPPNVAPPLAPANVTVQQDGPGALRLTWDDVAGASGYAVYPVQSESRDAAEGVPKLVVAPTRQLVWNGLPADRPSCFVVRAQNASKEQSPASEPQCATAAPAASASPTPTPSAQSPTPEGTTEPTGAYAVVRVFFADDPAATSNEILGQVQEIDTVARRHGYGPSRLADADSSARLRAQYTAKGARVVYLDGFRTVADAQNFCALVVGELGACRPSPDAGGGDGTITVPPGTTPVDSPPGVAAAPGDATARQADRAGVPA